MNKELVTIIHRRIEPEIERRKIQLGNEQRALLRRMSAKGMLRSGGTGKLIVELCIDELNARGEMIWRIIRESLARANEIFDDEASTHTKALIQEKLPPEMPELSGYISHGTKGFPDNAIAELNSMFKYAYENFRRRIEADIDLECFSSNSGGITSIPQTHAENFDVFVSHASEDKDDFVRPLVEALRNAGIQVWYDEFTLKWGDRLRRSIDHGLVSSKFGVVVLSPNFFEKEWPQRELDGLTALELDDGRKRVLPIWHNIDAAGIKQHSPTLGDVIGISSRKGMDFVVTKLLEQLNP